jgi:hypothetical protein
MILIWKSRDQAKVGRKCRSAQPLTGGDRHADQHQAGQENREIDRQSGPFPGWSASSDHWQFSSRPVP